MSVAEVRQEQATPQATPHVREQATPTRRRIVEAVATVAAEAHPTAFSVPAVAAAAGVSVRTVYRYFPTKEDLLDALAEFGGDAGTYLSVPGQATWADYLRLLPDLWHALEENRATVQAHHAAPVARAARQRRVASRRAKVRAALVHEAPDLAPGDLDGLTALCTALGSSVTLFELVDTLGLEVDDAAGLVSWAMQLLLDEARHRAVRTTDLRTTELRTTDMREGEVGHGPH